MCPFVYLLGETMRERIDWYLIGMDKDCDLRKLLLELLQKCLGMRSPNGEITWNEWTEYVSKRPFINKFKEEKKGERVFTASVLADFIFLCIKRDEINGVDEYLNKAVYIIRTSKYALDLEEYKEDTILECKSESILECLNRLKSNKGFIEKCKNCTAAWIFHNLQYIENNYESIISHKNVLPKYQTEEQRDLTEEIYNEIVRYETNPLEKLCDPDVMFPMFNTCIQSYDIPDVADEKLAYIKWYTAHFCNWPFLKASLLQAYHYNEFSIYQMLHSASNILSTLKSQDEELLSYVENERIVSYLTIGYTMPFSLFHCGSPQDIEISCLSVLQKITLPEHRLRILIALWNMHFHLGFNDLPKYEMQIEKIFKEEDNKNEDLLLLFLEFQLYRYLYVPGYRNNIKKSLLWMANDYYVSTGITETYDIIAELFFQHDKIYYPQENWQDTPTTLALAIKGRKDVNSQSLVVIQSPQKYHRVYLEYKLSEYLEYRRNNIMTHYNFWNNEISS